MWGSNQSQWYSLWHGIVTQYISLDTWPLKITVVMFLRFERCSAVAESARRHNLRKSKVSSFQRVGPPGNVQLGFAKAQAPKLQEPDPTDFGHWIGSLFQVWLAQSGYEWWHVLLGVAVVSPLHYDVIGLIGSWDVMGSDDFVKLWSSKIRGCSPHRILYAKLCKLRAQELSYEHSSPVSHWLKVRTKPPGPGRRASERIYRILALKSCKLQLQALGDASLLCEAMTPIRAMITTIMATTAMDTCIHSACYKLG